MGIFDNIFGKKRKEEKARLERERQENLKKEQEENARKERVSNAIQQGTPVKLLVFHTTSCGPSKKLIQDFEKTDLKYSIIDVEKEQELGEKYKIMYVPTIILVDENGEILNKWIGYDDEDPGQTKIVEYLRQFGNQIIIDGKTFSVNIDVLSQTTSMFENAKSLYELKQYSEAAQLFGQMIELQPENSNWYIYRGTTYEDMGLDDKAKPDFEKAVELAADDSLGLYRLGMLYARENNYDKAVEYLQRSFDNIYYLDNPLGKGLDNNLFFIHKKIIGNNLGFYLIQLGKNTIAYRILDDVISNCPDYSYAYYTKGLGFVGEKRFLDSVLLLQKAQELGHPQAEGLLSLVVMQSNIVNKSKDTDVKDSYSEMVRNTSFNPFNISLNAEDNENVQMGDMTSVFKQELNTIFFRVQAELDLKFFVQILTGYAFNLLESWYNNAGMVPKKAMDEILRQVYEACTETSQSKYLERFSLDDFKYHLYYNLTHK